MVGDIKDDKAQQAQLGGAPVAKGAGLTFTLPLITTLAATILTIVGTIIGAFLQSRATLQLEREKEQHDLVVKMISVGDLKQARENLQFLAESGLVADQQLASRILATKASPVLPRAAPITQAPRSALGLPDGAPCGPNGAHAVNGICVNGSQ